VIIVKISGGLGNQMFQYAAGIALAKSLGAECKFDVDWFNDKKAHNGLELSQVFNVNLPIATASDKKNIFSFYFYIYYFLGEKIFNKRFSFLNFKFLLSEIESNKNYKDYCNNNSKKNLYMSGYWQGEVYFKKIINQLRSEFYFSKKLNLSTKNWLDTIKKCPNAVSLHIRRGDYISDKKSANIMGNCSLDYYNSSINILNKKTNNPIFFIFSDDLEWAKKNLLIDNYQVYFVDGNIGKDSSLDMLLMSACSHHIIANSSFSWWGAWLGKSENQVVVAPNPWFFKTGKLGNKLYSNHWILLDKVSGRTIS
jgi:hypothetical protein